MSDARRQIPRTDVVLADPRFESALRRLDREVVRAAVRRAQEDARAGLIAPHEVADVAAGTLPAGATSLRPVINATGVVLHTNLGRAPLSPAARAALEVAAGYVDVEYDLATGARAARGRGALRALQAAVPAAEAALVVNNGAAALLLALTTLAAGREVVIARGEMVEIGDGFRLPELMTSTGARLREVGTTNRVTVADYSAAVGPDTGCVVKVHPSNFRIEGFTSSVPAAELSGLGVPVVVDVGSGLLTTHPSLPDEPDVTSALTAGASLVTASGDKLLGGPQAGLVFGQADVVQRLRRHPLARALRVDKLTLAALEATLIGATTPTWQALTADADRLRARCQTLADAVGGTVVASAGAVGGGGAPGVSLPGWAVALPPRLAPRLREHAVVARVEKDRCLIDLRCVGEEDDGRLAAAILSAAGPQSAP